MNTDKAKALLMRFNSGYKFDAMMAMGGHARLYIETIQDLLNQGYAFKAAYRPAIAYSELVPVSKAIEAYAFTSPDHEPVDINPNSMLAFEASLIAELLRNPPPVKPGGSFTQADMDAARKESWNGAVDAVVKAVQGMRR